MLKKNTCGDYVLTGDTFECTLFHLSLKTSKSALQILFAKIGKKWQRF